jgi:hypothetical protein
MYEIIITNCISMKSLKMYGVNIFDNSLNRNVKLTLKITYMRYFGCTEVKLGVMDEFCVENI